MHLWGAGSTTLWNGCTGWHATAALRPRKHSCRSTRRCGKRNGKTRFASSNKRLEVEHYRSNGQKWVEQYWDRYQPFDQGITIDLECKVFIDLPGGGKVMGYIDRLEKVGNKHFVIHDYKTSGKLPTPHATKNDRQLALYMLGIKQRYPDLKKIDLVWHFVRFDEDMWSQRTDEQLQKMAEQTASLIETVDAAVARRDLPTKTSALCDWCEFRPLCPEFANLYEMENQEETLLASVITASEGVSAGGRTREPEGREAAYYG